MHPLQPLNKYLFKYRYRLLGGIFFVALSNLFAIFPAQVLRHSLDILQADILVSRTMEGFSSHQVFLKDLSMIAFTFGLLILSLAILKGVFLFFTRQMIIVMSRLIEYDLKNEIFDHYQKLSVAFYRRNNTGDLMARISEDVSRVRMYIGPAIMYSMNLLVLFVLVVSTMVSVNLRLTLFVLFPLPLLAVLIYYVSSIIENKSDRVQNQLSILSTYVQEALSGIRILKSHGREDFAVNEFASESEKYRGSSLSLAKTNALFFPIILLLLKSSIIE